MLQEGRSINILDTICAFTAPFMRLINGVHQKRLALKKARAECSESFICGSVNLQTHYGDVVFLCLYLYASACL